MPKKRPDPNRPRRWNMLIKRLPKDRDIVGAEIGVWMGQSSQQILAQMPNVFLYMVDAWTVPQAGSSYLSTPDTIAKQNQLYFDQCMDKSYRAVRPFAGRYSIIREWSWEAVKRFEDGEFDFVFIDADHSYEGVKAETLRWLPKVKKGGIMAWHDVGNLPRYPGVEKAIDEVIGMDNVERDGDCTGFYRV